MSQKIRFKKQHKPIGFGDRPDPDSVEGHRNTMAEAAETRRYNRVMRELEAEKATEWAAVQGIEILRFEVGSSL